MPIVQRLAAVAGALLAGVAVTGAGPAGEPTEQDKQYLQRAHQSHLAEIQAGMIAQRRGDHALIRELATRFVSDHTRLDESLRKTAGDVKVSLPETPTPEQQALARQLENTSGPAFDQLFISTRMEAHQSAVTLDETELAKGSAAEVKQLATDAVKVRQAHHQALVETSRQMAGPSRIDGGNAGLAAPPRRRGLALTFLAAALAFVVAGGYLLLRRRQS